MEPPQSESSEDIRNEKVKALEALRPLLTGEDIERNTLRGQYTASRINDSLVEGYREEQGVAQQSLTETFAAVRFFVDNERWKGTPFYVRTAKRMPTTVTELVIYFKRPEQQIFQYSAGHSKKNILVIRIQPNEGILLKFGVKQPGQGFKAQQVNMDFYYDSFTDRKVLQAYERLLLDALNGDATLYARAEEVEKASAGEVAIGVDPQTEEKKTEARKSSSQALKKKKNCEEKLKSKKVIEKSSGTSNPSGTICLPTLSVIKLVS